MTKRDGIPTPEENRLHILRMRAEAMEMVQNAEADPEKRGLRPARDALRSVEQLMKDYGIKAND